MLCWLSFKGDIAVWEHEIDFHPPNTPDTARLERLGPTSVLEKGLGGDFSELWWSIGSGDGKYLGIQIKQGARTERMLVIVGDHFVYARDRSRDLPPAESLSLDFVREITVDGSGTLAPRTSTPGWSVPVNTFAGDDLRVLFPHK